MDPRRHDALARRLDTLAARHPRGYHAGVVLLGLAGYLYLVAVPTLLVLGAAALVVLIPAGRGVLAIKLALPLLALGGMVLRSLWVRVEPPGGIALRREQAPALFRDVEALADAVRAPRPHVVLLSDRLNASVVQVPRLGVFGWPCNYLVLGVPLLHALSPAQGRAVLAHELAHLSRAHGRSGVWIYRLRQSWQQLLEALEQRRHRAAGVFTTFFRWYSPRFDAATLTLSRAHEFEADRLAAAATGPEALGDALLRLEVCGRFEETHFWAEFWQRADDLPAPPEPGPAALAHALRGELTPAAGTDWMRQAMAAETTPLDTHPALRERLVALHHPAAGEAQPALPDAGAERAAEAWLGAESEAVLHRLDTLWWNEVGEAWREQHQEAQRAEARLAELEEEAWRAPLDAERLWEYALLRRDRRGDEAAVEPLTRLLEEAPDHAGAHFERGRILASRDDETGAAHLERAMEVEPAFTPLACPLLHHLWCRRGDEERAEAVRLRAVAYDTLRFDVEQTVQAPLRRGDRFLPHAAGPEGVARLAAALAEVHGAERAYLVRKPVTGHDAVAVHVLAVEVRHTRGAGSAREQNQRAVEALLERTEFLGDRLICSLNGNPRWFRRRLRRVPGAEVSPCRTPEADLLRPSVALPA